MPESEIDRLDPDPVVVKLSNGSAVDLLRLQTRQLFKLLKILTHGGMGAGIMNALDFSLPPDEFIQRLITMLFLSIPDAENEAIAFIAAMVEPHGLAKKPKLSKQEAEDNQARFTAAAIYLDNPPPEDTVDIIVAIIQQEAPELQSLGKRIAQVVELFTRTGQDKEKPGKPSAAASPENH